MINLSSNANNTVHHLCHEDGVIAYWHDVCDKYANGYIQVFVTNLQILITKVGIIISKVSTNKVNISYCAQSISYLCNTVLNRPELEKSFNRLGLNDKGNKGKHDIVNNKINLDEAVALFNQLINAIASRYSLPALKSLIIVKKANNKGNGVNVRTVVQPQIVYIPQPNKPAQKPQPNKKHPQPQPNLQEKATSHDEKITITANLIKGDGYYEKGIFLKKKKLNFILKVLVKNYNNLKIKDLFAVFTCGKNKIVKDIKFYNPKENNDIEAPIDLDADMFSGKISASVVMEYKIGLFKTKRITAKVSKNF